LGKIEGNGSLLFQVGFGTLDGKVVRGRRREEGGERRRREERRE
jgi:hypothetical protein